MQAVVLVDDRAYQEQVSTTIKPILYYNKNLRVYVFNQGLSDEWFRDFYKLAKRLDSVVINLQFDKLAIRVACLTKDYISTVAYASYFISQLVVEDRFLYLDCDRVVNGDLTPLFDESLKGKLVLAVDDARGKGFNTGVLLINVDYWREHDVAGQLIEMTDDLHEKVSQDDQSILNILFENRWLELPFAYNCITLHTTFSDYEPEKGLYPPVIHYLTERKSWKEYTQSIYREVWWYYQGLDWSDMQEPIKALTSKMVEGKDGATLSCLIYTYSCDLMHINYLIQSLPACHFYIAAPVVVAEPITRLLQYPNVSVSSDIAGIPALMESLEAKSQLLLDINAGDEVGDIIARFKFAGKPVFAFDSTVHGQQGQEVFPADNPEVMVQAIEKLRLAEPEERQISVLSIDQSLDYLFEKGASVVRFGEWGDGFDCGAQYPLSRVRPRTVSALERDHVYGKR